MHISITGLLLGLWSQSALCQNSKGLISRATDCSDGVYKTTAGLNFKVQCGKDYLTAEITHDKKDSLADCLGWCADYAGELCYGAVYDSDSTYCWLKNGDILAGEAEDNSTLSTGIADSANYKVKSSDCGQNEGATIDTPSGGSFKTYCNKNLDEKYTFGSAHATSLAECAQLCAEADGDLCLGVTWNPDSGKGFRNCYFKYPNVTAENLLDNPNVINHAALLPSKPEISGSCADKTDYVSHAQKKFHVLCNTNAGSTWFDKAFAKNMDICMELCAKYNMNNTACNAVLFDNTAAQGFQNCYYQNTINYTASDGWAYASVISNFTTESPTNPDVNTDKNDPKTDDYLKKNNSKAWIAGPILGGFVGLMIIAAIIVFFIRRRRQQKAIAARSAKKEEETAFISSYNQTTPYAPPEKAGPYYNSHNVYYDSVNQPGSAATAHPPVSEMPATAPSDRAPVELPDVRAEPSELPASSSNHQR